MTAASRPPYSKTVRTSNAAINAPLAAVEIRGLTNGDSGAVGAVVIDGRTAAGAALVTRPPLEVRNFGTQISRWSAAGGFVIQGGTTPSFTLGASGTAITQIRVYAPSLTPASVAANTTAEQTFTVAGLSTGDKVMVNSIAALGDGLSIAGVRVSATDTLAIRFANNTGGPLTPAAGVYPTVATRS